MKFICADCAIFDEPRKISFFKALWHKLRGHHVIKAWKYDSSIWEVAVKEG